MALKLNGRDDNVRRADIRALAVNAGLTVADADAATDSMLDAMRVAVERVALPEKIARTLDPNNVIAGMLEICRNRVTAFE